MGAFEPLHVAGPCDIRLLGELLRAGVVMLDHDQQCCQACPRACSELGAPDEATLRQDWARVRTSLSLERFTELREGGAPLHQPFDIPTTAGTKRLRCEAHAINGCEPSRFMMLVRGREFDVADRTQLLASEFIASRHIVTSMLHDANGPLNNVHLALALLASSLAHLEADVDAATYARVTRYLDVLQAEEKRLAERLNAIGAYAQPRAPVREPVDITGVLRAIRRLLRHEATLHEAVIDVDAPDAPIAVIADPHQLQLALLHLCTSLIEGARRGAIITLRLHDADDVRIDLEATGVTLPEALDADLFRVSCASGSDFAAAIASRMIIEGVGGELTIVRTGTTHGFEVRLARATSSSDD